MLINKKLKRGFTQLNSEARSVPGLLCNLATVYLSFPIFNGWLL